MVGLFAISFGPLSVYENARMGDIQMWLVPMQPRSYGLGACPFTSIVNAGHIDSFGAIAM